jgi:hypothetical protein
MEWAGGLPSASTRLFQSDASADADADAGALGLA